MIHKTHAIRRITTRDAAIVDELIDATVEKLIPEALALNHGIRVTRIGPGEFTVETAADVACGYTAYAHL
jgi:hypothetical protein